VAVVCIIVACRDASTRGCGVMGPHTAGVQNRMIGIQPRTRIGTLLTTNIRRSGAARADEQVTLRDQSWTMARAQDPPFCPVSH
jgi:hypothetical protein